MKGGFSQMRKNRKNLVVILVIAAFIAGSASACTQVGETDSYIGEADSSLLYQESSLEPIKTEKKASLAQSHEIQQPSPDSEAEIVQEISFLADESKSDVLETKSISLETSKSDFSALTVEENSECKNLAPNKKSESSDINEHVSVVPKSEISAPESSEGSYDEQTHESSSTEVSSDNQISDKVDEVSGTADANQTKQDDSSSLLVGPKFDSSGYLIPTFGIVLAENTLITSEHESIPVKKGTYVRIWNEEDEFYSISNYDKSALIPKNDVGLLSNTDNPNLQISSSFGISAGDDTFIYCSSFPCYAIVNQDVEITVDGFGIDLSAGTVIRVLNHAPSNLGGYIIDCGGKQITLISEKDINLIEVAEADLPFEKLRTFGIITNGIITK